MSKKRSLVFTNDEYYHVFNRGIDRRVTFTNKREYTRAVDLLSFYQYVTIPLRYSRYMDTPEEMRQIYFDKMLESGKLVDVIAFCLMPNHFHLLIKQRIDNGIATYIANFVNAYTKYLNKKYQRTGPLFQGVFKAVYVETEEQLVHLTRYIHLNPVASSVISSEQLSIYPWTSFPIYEDSVTSDIVEKDTVALIHSLVPDYKKFVMDQVSYSKELEKIKHMTFEHE